ncbi:YHS domain-containing (seleno)protein [Breoghania sp.]|uniref:YHS domain-containing (seleno)protein n=1 Tax=Breoghania sp. TaxID=2065378 RepID=UPI00260C7788|nr:YHS domain-containing (seleno)protein [Breoghania sp.]MDJ0929868.1 YHS domain-containing (seleno)protein [Breoghania sp.]
MYHARISAVLCIVAGLATVAPAPLMADEVTTYVKDGAALGGIDPVAYFTDMKPVMGSDEFTATHDGVTWKFVSAEHRDMFTANPAKYAPAYGGYCATSASFGYKIPIDPKTWDIHDGKLYLNAGDTPHKRYLFEVEGIISRADTNWRKIKNVPADQL